MLQRFKHRPLLAFLLQKLCWKWSYQWYWIYMYALLWKFKCFCKGYLNACKNELIIYETAHKILVLIWSVSSVCSNMPVYTSSLARAFSYHICKVWKQWKVLTKYYISSPTGDINKGILKKAFVHISGLHLRVDTKKLDFLFLNQNICCGYSKEPSQWDDSFEGPKHMVKLMGKKILTLLLSRIVLI